MIYLKAQRVQKKIARYWSEWRGNSNQIYFEHRLDEYRQMWQAIASELRVQFTELTDDLWELSFLDRRMRVLNYQLELDNPVVLQLAGRKTLVHQILKAENIPVPAYQSYSLGELDKAVEFFRRFPKGCVVKPANGYAGKGVTTHIESIAEVRNASILASLYGSELLIEPQIPGECYRLLVFRGRLLDVVCRRGPRLIADGRQTLAELINQENERRYQNGIAPVVIDRDCLFTLEWQGVNLDSAPEAGREILIKTVHDSSGGFSEVRTVYNSNVTDQICPEIKETAERIADILGAEFIGVDIITPDCSKPLWETGGAVNEVNTTPALHHHYDAAKEKFPRPALTIAAELLGLTVEDFT